MKRSFWSEKEIRVVYVVEVEVEVDVLRDVLRAK